MYTRAQLEALKVVDLKEILRSAGLKMTGAKAEQVDRILAAKLSAPVKSPKKAPVKKASAKSPKKAPAKSPAVKSPAVKALKAKKASVPKRVPMIPVLEARVPPRSPGRSAPLSPIQIRPVVGQPRPVNTSQYGYVPPGRADNLETKAVIKAIVYGPPPPPTRGDRPILSNISWSVSSPLSLAQIEPEEAEMLHFDPNAEYFLPFTDEAKRELNRQFLGYEIYVDAEHIEDPNAPQDQEYLEYGGLLHLESPDPGPLTQWQVLRGLEQYYQWYMARMGGVDALGNHIYFEGLQHVADLNGIPVYMLILGS